MSGKCVLAALAPTRPQHAFGGLALCLGARLLGGRTTAGNTPSPCFKEDGVFMNSVARRSGIREVSAPFSCPAAASGLRPSGKPNRQDSLDLRPMTVVASITIFLRHPEFRWTLHSGVHPFRKFARLSSGRCVVFRVRHALVQKHHISPVGLLVIRLSRCRYQSAFGSFCQKNWFIRY